MSEIDEVRKIIFSKETVENAIDDSIKKDPDRIANIIYPIIGISIRRSVMDYLEKMLLAFNSAVESAFSIQGLKWRISAWTSGRPYSEIVLLHNLVFKVDDVFVIHKVTGLLLLHASREQGSASNADQISGMLSALRGFIKTALPSDPTCGALRSIRSGSVELVMEESSDLLIAAAISGQGPPDYRQLLQKKLSEFQTVFSDELRTFNGDTRPFFTYHTRLRDCLLVESKPPEKRNTLMPKIVAGLLGLGVLIILSWFGVTKYFDYKDEKLINAYAATIESTQGLVLLGYSKDSDGQWFVRILRSTNFRGPVPALPERLRARVRLHFRPYVEAVASNPLSEFAIPYDRSTFRLNGNHHEQIKQLTSVVASLQLESEHEKMPFVHLFVYEPVAKKEAKIFLSRFIGLLESALASEGGHDLIEFKYSILPMTNVTSPAIMRFEIKYD